MSSTAAILRNAICLSLCWLKTNKSPNSPSACLTHHSIYIYMLDQVTSPHQVRRNSRITATLTHIIYKSTINTATSLITSLRWLQRLRKDDSVFYLFIPTCQTAESKVLIVVKLQVKSHLLLKVEIDFQVKDGMIYLK